ncbi:MAG: sigma-54-dependent Fis family transcriptional regulator [Myxococcales bacterium]|nr:sigma-54-dependent Fis family transcriptional regulator [Myxococcales bacterium]
MTTQTGPARVLVIDDEVSVARALEVLLGRAEFDVACCTEPEDAMAAAMDPGLSVVLVDLNLPGTNGMEILSAVKVRHPEVQVVVMTGQGTISAATAAVRKGAWDFITKPFDSLDDVVDLVTRAASHCRLMRRNRELEELVTARPGADFVGTSEGMREVFRLIEQVSGSSATVLVTGESGTGKELVARSLHQKSPRARRPFIAVNCAAMTPTLLESELFGHVKGAFTGATSSKRGLFEAANGGTLFLDEIGDVPPSTQVALLRALQEGEVRPVGATEHVKVDVRVIAATNADLKKAMAQGRFREDLFYRLNVISIALPPLRTRRQDVALLAYHFLAQHSARARKKVERFSPEALRALEAFSWPGNVRELENVVERAVVLARGPEVTVGELPQPVARAAAAPEEVAEVPAATGETPLVPYVQAKRAALGAFDQQYLARVLKKTSGNITAAAALAGLDRSNFRRLVKQYQAPRAQSLEAAPVSSATH